jgi:hypothetical protein
MKTTNTTNTTNTTIEPLESEKPVETKRLNELIDNYIADMVIDFLHYDRNEDDDLPLDLIENSVKAGTLTIDEMVESFRKYLTKGILLAYL